MSVILATKPSQTIEKKTFCENRRKSAKLQRKQHKTTKLTTPVLMSTSVSMSTGVFVSTSVSIGAFRAGRGAIAARPPLAVSGAHLLALTYGNFLAGADLPRRSLTANGLRSAPNRARNSGWNVGRLLFTSVFHENGTLDSLLGGCLDLFEAAWSCRKACQSGTRRAKPSKNLNSCILLQLTVDSDAFVQERT